MDVLTDLLGRSQARGAAFARTRAAGAWGVRFRPRGGLAVHVVVEGDVHLWTGPAAAPGPARHLLPGDLVLVRGDLEHRLAHRPRAACTSLEELLPTVDPGSATLTVGDGEGPTAGFFCGAFLFDGELCDGLLRALPEVVHQRPAAGSSLRATLDLLAAELGRAAPGQQTLLDRLLDVALIQVLRDELATRPDAAPSWFRAGDDPAVSLALEAVHADPAHPWTVGELAAVALLSRAAFARRFTAALGEAPLTYLAGWRMALARERLRTGHDGLAAIAAEVGYRSEYAFAAAFKRHHGIAPGRWRAAAARPTAAPAAAADQAGAAAG